MKSLWVQPNVLKIVRQQNVDDMIILKEKEAVFKGSGILRYKNKNNTDNLDQEYLNTQILDHLDFKDQEKMNTMNYEQAIRSARHKTMLNKIINQHNRQPIDKLQRQYQKQQQQQQQKYDIGYYADHKVYRSIKYYQQIDRKKEKTNINLSVFRLQDWTINSNSSSVNYRIQSAQSIGEIQNNQRKEGLKVGIGNDRLGYGLVVDNYVLSKQSYNEDGDGQDWRKRKGCWDRQSRSN